MLVLRNKARGIFYSLTFLSFAWGGWDIILSGLLKKGVGKDLYIKTFLKKFKGICLVGKLKSKNLSFFEKVTLTQAFTSIPPLYSTIFIPRSICDELDEVNRKFVWGSSSQTKKSRKQVTQYIEAKENKAV